MRQYTVVKYISPTGNISILQVLDTNFCLVGFQVISMDPLTRRSRFILCVAVGLGLGVTIVPNWATNNLWDVYPTTGSGLAGFRSPPPLLHAYSLAFEH